MYVDLVKHLEDLEHRFGPDSNTFKGTSQAFKDHPNLRAYLDHIGCIRLCSVDVNPFVDLIDITHRTDQGSLEVLPHIKDKGVCVYADPPIYVVGYRNPKGFGEVPLADWQALMEDAGLSPEVIRKVKWYLGAHRAVNYDEVPD
jgi:hypothetical protein